MTTSTQTLNLYDYLSRTFLLLLAVFLQVQITLFASGDYLGLRLNSADFLLPGAGVFILGSLILKKSVWPQWKKPFGYWALILLSAVIVLGILNGYRIQGDWSTWAVLNKGLGWFVLMGYFMMAAWFAHNRAQDIRNWFLRPFVIFLCAVTIAEIFIRLLFIHSIIEYFTVFSALKVPELSGFMANRNAFAFLYLSTLIVSAIFLLKKISLHPIESVAFRLMWLLLPVFFVMNASRSSALIFVPLMLFLIVSNWRFFLKTIAPLVLIGCLLLPLINKEGVSRQLRNYNTITLLTDRDAQNGSFNNLYVGDQARLVIINDSLKLLKENPITGAGIGSVFKYQNTLEDREFVAVIDNTALWVLAEMGPFGFIAFACVFFTMIVALSKNQSGDDKFNDVFSHSLIYILIGFGFFSLFHEILYSRFLWVFLGLTLAHPIFKTRQDG